MKVIFTTHAQQRLRKRRLAQSDIERAVSNPDKTFPGKKEGTVKFIKHIDGRQHQVIGKFLKDQNAWLVLSVWVRGEEDFDIVTWLITAPFKVLGRVLQWIFRL